MRIAGALVQIQGYPTGSSVEFKTQGLTDSTGTFLIKNVPWGIYTMTASANGYLPITYYNVHVGDSFDPKTTTVVFGLTATLDWDADGLTDSQEQQLGTDPYGYQKWAVIATGGYTDLTWQTNFENQADEACRVLHGLGVDDAHMYYMSFATVKRDADKDRKNDIDALTTKANIQYALQTWLASKSDADDRVFIYLVDHGGYYSNTQIGYFCIGNEVLDDTELDAWANSVVCHNMTFVIDCCNSGYFLSDLTDGGTLTNRLAIAASDMITGTLTYQDWTLFSHTFFQSLASGESMEGAFNLAYTNACYMSHNREIPMMSDPLPYLDFWL